MKKLLSVLLAVMMLLSALPVMAEEVETPVSTEIVTGGDQGTELPEEPKAPEHNHEGLTKLIYQDVHYAYAGCDACEKETVVAKDCTGESYTAYFCQEEGCDETFKHNVSVGTHTVPYTEDGEVIGTRVKEPTCTEFGVIETVCTVCETVFPVSIDKNPHVYGEPVTVPATCTVDGEIYQVCEVCGNKLVIEVLPATGHNMCTEEEREYLVDTLYCWSENPSVAVSFLYCKNVGCDHTVSYPDGSMYFYDLHTYHQNEMEDLIKVEAGETAAEVAAEIWAAATADDNDIYEFAPVYYYDVKGDKTGYQVHLNDAKVVYVPATCYEDGYLTLTCIGEEDKVCGSTVTLVIPAHAHDYIVDEHWLETHEENAPTCLTDGTVLIHCKHEHCDFEEQININAPGHHDFEDENEQKVYHLLYVQETTKHGTVEAFGWSNEEVPAQIVKCMPYDVYTMCWGIYTPVELTVDSDNDGENDIVWVEIYCDAKSEGKTVAATEEHTIDGNNYAYSAPTCTEEGYKIFNCALCGTTETTVVKPFDHKKVDAQGNWIDEDGDGEWDTAYTYNPLTDKIAPTCTEDGSITWTCTLCGDVKVQVMPATGHGWDNGKEDFHYEWNSKPHCGREQNGSQTWHCDYCAATKEVVIAWEHVKPATGVSVKPATCLTTGESTFTCDYCHKNVKVTEKALGHSWERIGHKEDVLLAADSEYNTTGVDQWYDGYVRATCTEKGYYWRECDDAACDMVKTTGKPHYEKLEVGEKMPHVLVSAEVTDGVNLIIDSAALPTCEATGIAYYNCALCGIFGYDEIVLPALPHNPVMTWNEEKHAYEYTCEELLWNDGEGFEEMWTEYDNALYNVIIDRIDPNLDQDTRDYWANEYLTKAKADMKTRMMEMVTVRNADGTVAYQKWVVRGVGCDTVLKEIPVNKTHYTIEKEGNVVTLTPDENCALLANPMLVVNWAYTLSDGSSFGYTRVIEGNVDKLTYKLGVAKAPYGAVLDAITVIVTDTDDASLTAAAKGYGYVQFK